MAKQTGTLNHHAEAGAFVKTDDLIATLENVDLKNTYNLAKRAEQIAKNAYERTLELSKKNTSSKKNVEQALLEWINAKKDLAKIKIDLDKTLITAPFDGIVGNYKVHDGSQVTEGCPLITFFQPNDLIVEFDVPEPIVSKVKNGSKVFVNNKPYTLTHVQKLVDPDTHMAPAFLNYHEKALPGSNVDVDLIIQENSNTIVIPYESLIIKNGNFCVYVVINEKVELRKVTLGIREKENIEILTGLKTGEKVILRGQSSLYPGISVQSHES
jgi:membrane fusion protein (multidrug efflux system)